MKEYAPDGDTLIDFFEYQNPDPDPDAVTVKVVQGPIGSGKSLICAMSLWHSGCIQIVRPDGFRYSRFHVFRDCYDDQTEILTEKRGWVLFKDLLPEDRVAQLNGDYLEFVKPIAHIAKDYVGEMIGFESEGVDFRVTPNHRLWASPIHGRKREWLPYRFMMAGDAYGRDIRVRRDAAWRGIPTHLSEKVFEWLGFWFAEGCGGIDLGKDGYSRKRLILTQVKPDGVAYAHQLFADAGIPFSAVKNGKAINFRVLVRPETQWLFDLLCGLGGALRKAMPPEIKQAPAAHLRAFLRGYIIGDGFTSKGMTKAYTSSRQLADDLQEIALKAGWVANLHEANHGLSMAAGEMGIRASCQGWSLSFVSDKKFRPRLNEKYREQKTYRRWYSERYAGKIYCVEVPTHIVYVRRNGKAFWCGQTYGRLEDTTLKTWLEWFPEKEFGHFFRSKPYRHEIRVGDVSMDVHFVALEDANAVDYFKSMETTGVWWNEVQFIDRILFDESTSRVGRYPRKVDGGPVKPFVIADMNAPDETHWVPIMRGDVACPDWFTQEQRKAHIKPEHWKFFVQPAGLIEQKDGEGDVIGYKPNPKAENTKYLPSGYYQNAVLGKTKSWIDANVLNRVSPRRDGKPVLKDFSRAVYVAKQPLEPIPGLELLIGQDFGRRPAAIFGQCLRGRWYILHELIARDTGAAEFAKLLRLELAQRFPKHKFRIWGDPSGDFKGQNDEQVPFQIFRANRLPVLPAPSILFSVRLQAMEAVMSRMSEGKPDLVISPTCTTLIAALDGGWHYRRLKVAGAERYEDMPHKDQYSDPADACGYLLLGGGEGKAVLTGSSQPSKSVSTKRPYNPFGQKQAIARW